MNSVLAAAETHQITHNVEAVQTHVLWRHPQGWGHAAASLQGSSILSPSILLPVFLRSLHVSNVTSPTDFICSVFRNVTYHRNCSEANQYISGLLWAETINAFCVSKYWNKDLSQVGGRVQMTEDKSACVEEATVLCKLMWSQTKTYYLTCYQEI